MVQKTYYTKIVNLFLILFLFGMISTNAQSVFKDFGWKGGLRLNGVLPVNEFSDDNGISLNSFIVDGYLRYELSNDWNLELNGGYGKMKGDDYNNSEFKTTIVPIELRLLYTPFDIENWNPYFYAGFGGLYYHIDTFPVSKSPVPLTHQYNWTGVIPVGVGTEIKLADEIFLDISAGINYSLTDNLNGFIIDKFNDGYINVGLGITFSNESLNTDKDHDGLTKKEELKLGTDPNNPDTDGDGLKDGEEVKVYKTNPLKADTDGDGLNDGDEVMKYKTDPLNPDTDGDGLTDGDEVLKYHTDPLKADTDGDGLKDGDEVLKYKTDPLKVDTDGDGLTDGEEVMKYKTDPLKVDTDGGTIGDGVEVKRGTNPLDPSDDVPPAIVEKELNLDMVHFAFNKFNLSKDAKKILDSDFDALSKYTEPKISLSGHCDFIGSDDYNMKLSVKRANSVKDYLVKKGLDEKLFNVEGFGKSKPLDPAKTDTARAKNRRTEVSAKVMEKVAK
jgi:outer membrane protein OmpA-like peptidoglycan-associated protein